MQNAVRDVRDPLCLRGDGDETESFGFVTEMGAEELSMATFVALHATPPSLHNEVEMKLFDTVRLVRDIQSEGLKAGMVGTVVMVHTEEMNWYEVEFVDDDGRTIAQLALSQDDLKLLSKGD